MARRSRYGRSKRTAAGNVSRICGARIFLLLPEHLAGRLIQYVRPRIGVVKVEHVVDRAGDGIEGAATHALSTQPIVFDETQHRRLIGQTVVDIVAPGEGRDHQQRQAWAISASALCMVYRGAWESGRPITA